MTKHLIRDETESKVNWLIKSGLLPLALVAANCFAVNTVVTGSAVGDFVIGRAPPTVKNDRLIFRRWQNDENGKRYELIRVKVQGIEVDAEVYDGTIWRIWIEEAGLMTRDGLGVGDDARTLLRKNPTVNPEIGPGPSLVFIPTKPCGISYVTDAQLLGDIDGRLTQKYISQIARTAHITKIIVVGCKK